MEVNVLPPVVWYLGFPLDDDGDSVKGWREDDGRTYTILWTEESIAREFEAARCGDGSSVQSSPTARLLAKLAVSGCHWVAIDVPRPDDGLLDNPRCRRLNVTRRGDMWPFVSAFLRSIGVPQDAIDLLTKFTQAHPDAPLWQMVVNFMAIEAANEGADVIRQTLKNCEDYAELLGKDMSEVIAATLTSGGWPHFSCPKCSESAWKFVELSPTGASSRWLCTYCGRKIFVKASLATWIE